ncbi:metal ABC transporter permease [Erysipelothrix sp. HDW6A]|uniref:metal ABC transporter permease n=1 Tax=Erysipelothrix sp. HDW6A TaxID=2714928 RepID=UPI0014083A76|nr:metal ABC transporter permease [Erysipelothrix sp. HDW6A]QIK56840.1 metal ABC transporter permease [Erysipelothrix sp. HDW6A]
MDQILRLFSDYTFQVVAIGSVSLGVLSGLTGTFAVLRKQSLIGDSIAHSSLAGIAIAFMLTQTKNTEVLLLGALIIGLISTYITSFIAKNSRVNFESSMALVMASFFGLGLMLLTEIQKTPNSNQAGLNRFLFGQAATILERDVSLILIITAVVALATALFWKELKFFTFDPISAQIQGFNSKILNTLLSAFVVVSVVMGIQMVGVVLMSALLIAPAVAARQWTHSLLGMTLLSSLLGGISGLSGTIISSTVSQFPTGPGIVLVASVIVILSLLFAPQRGILARKITQSNVRKSHYDDILLLHLIENNKLVKDESYSKDVLVDIVKTDDHKMGSKSVDAWIHSLMNRSFLELTSDSLYSLTDSAYENLYLNGKGETL